MARMPQDIIETILEKTDLVATIRSTHALKPDGAGRFAGHCPFHDGGGATASLIVDPATQRAECAICQFHVSAIGWLMYHDGHTFPSAVLTLARQAGVDVSAWIDEASVAAAIDAQSEILAEVAGFYQDALENSSDTMRYLAARRITPPLARNFGLGVALDDQDGDTLLDAFAGRERQLHQAGILLRQSDGHYYPRFRNRLMFPILGVDGAVLGFGGRTLGNHPIKYLNSAASIRYDKSASLYGFYQAARPIEKAGRAIIVEGYLDVIAAHQAGFQETVSPLGTSLSDAQLALCLERAGNVVICFDGDAAGRRAAHRAVATAYRSLADDQSVSVALLPPGEDPDSLLAAGKRRAFNASVDAAIPGADFLVDELAKDFDTTSVGGGAALAEAVRDAVPSNISEQHKNDLIAALARHIGIEIDWHA